MDQKEKYNIALYPQDPQLIADCVELAQNNFASQADQYLLGNDASPHITLCKFEIEACLINQVWAEISLISSEPVSLFLERFYIKPGQDDPINHYWAGISLRQLDSLLALQRQVYSTLLKQNIQSKTNPENYFPHLTLARCTNDLVPETTLRSLQGNEDFFASPKMFKLSLGHSWPLGIYKKPLFIV